MGLRLGSDRQRRRAEAPVSSEWSRRVNDRRGQASRPDPPKQSVPPGRDPMSRRVPRRARASRPFLLRHPLEPQHKALCFQNVACEPSRSSTSLSGPLFGAECTAVEQHPCHAFEMPPNALQAATRTPLGAMRSCAPAAHRAASFGDIVRIRTQPINGDSSRAPASSQSRKRAGSKKMRAE